MSFRSQIKVLRNSLANAIALIVLISASQVFAQQNDKLQVHGFIAQGMIKANGSDFVNDDGDLSFELTEVGVNASYQINNSVRFAGQGVYLNAGNRLAAGARIDYALIDWSAYQSLSSQLNIYIGRYKNYHWLYSSTRDVPFTRPSIVLPQSVYFDGFRDIAVGGDGIALSYKHNKEGWGDFDFIISHGTSNISNEQTSIILSEFAKGDMEHDLDYQASIYWQPEASQWRFGAAVVDADFTYKADDIDNFQNAGITLQRYLFNMLYEGERWEISGEAIQERFVLDGFYYPDYHQDNFGQGFFVQSRYQVNSKVKFLSRFEKFYSNKDDRSGKKLEESTNGLVPSYFGYQHDITLGLSISFMPNLELQFEHHWVEGTARLTPVVLPNRVINDQRKWRMWAAQLMYWF
ncbi:hypothetical protein [Colwellia sp. MEBiC06753]